MTNPVLLVEALSEATRDYDRGEKLAAYQTIPSLREVLLIEQDTVMVERLYQSDSGSWIRDTSQQIETVIRLTSVDVALPLGEVYREVFNRSGRRN